MRQLIEGWFHRFGEFTDLRLALRMLNDRPLPQAIVFIDGSWFRAHIEQTICDSCEHRVSAAAIWDTSGSLGFPKEKKESINQRIFQLPVLSCPNCAHSYRRRGVFWLSPKDRPNKNGGAN
jgi:hypothetical protein